MILTHATCIFCNKKALNTVCSKLTSLCHLLFSAIFIDHLQGDRGRSQDERGILDIQEDM